jgi:predicted phage-related endonuclease
MTSVNTDDFAPEVRNAAWWSGDSRLAASGRAADAILVKQGRKEPPDLSDVEEVQMGKVMEPTIARLFQDRHKIELKDADWVGTHKTEQWFKSHADYISANGKILVECKNYNAASINKFDEETNLIPAADMAQLVHEAACFNVDEIYLAVLFGGQRFRTFHFNITQEMKDELVKEMAKLWGLVVSNADPEAHDVESTKLIWPTASEETATATGAVERACQVLAEYKARIKQLETEADKVETSIREYMGSRGSLVTVDGKTLVTWRNAKASKKFAADLFQQAMPDVYQKFVIEVPGSRRFLLK